MDFESPLASAVLTINGGESTKTADEEGTAYFETSRVESISYNYLGRNERIIIDDKAYNDIVIFAQDIDTGAVPDYFVDELVVAKRNKIIMYPNSAERTFRIKRARNGKIHWK